MRLNGVKLLLACLTCFAALGAEPRPLASVESIDIKSVVGGLPGDVRQSETKITRSGDVYLSNGRAVDPIKVGALVSALERNARATPLLSDFAITDAWLKATAGAAFSQYINNGRGEVDQGFYTPQERALYISSFRSTRVVSTALVHYYGAGNMALDYSPDVTVTVTKSDGAAITAHSDRQPTLMLPWTITTDGTARNSFDPNISEAVAALMPSSDPNYATLSRETLMHELPMLVGEEISAAWDKLPAFDTKRLVSRLEKQYKVHLSHGASTMTSDALLAWNADLSWDDSPPNVNAVVTLPIVDNAIRNTEAIPAARNFMLFVTHIPWIRSVMSSRRSIKLTILIENNTGTTLSPEAQAKFVADMRGLKKAAVTRELTDLPRAVSVMFDQDEDLTFSDWVIFPDGNAVLWNYYDAPVLDLGTAVVEQKCPSGSIEKCSGLLRRPDGAIIP